MKSLKFGLNLSCLKQQLFSSLRRRRNLISASRLLLYILNASPLPPGFSTDILLLGPQRTQRMKGTSWLANQTMAISTGQSWVVLRSRYTGGDPNKDFVAVSQTALTRVQFHLWRWLLWQKNALTTFCLQIFRAVVM